MPTSSLSEAAQDTMEDVSSQAQDAATDAATDVQDRVVDETQQTADAARNAADAFDANSLQAAALDHLAQNIEGVTDALRQKTVEGLADDVAVFARRNPLLFLGGAAAVGFAAARFLKSSPEPEDADIADPWSDHLDDARGGV